MQISTSKSLVNWLQSHAYALNGLAPASISDVVKLCLKHFAGLLLLLNPTFIVKEFLKGSLLPEYILESHLKGNILLYRSFKNI